MQNYKNKSFLTTVLIFTFIIKRILKNQFHFAQNLHLFLLPIL